MSKIWIGLKFIGRWLGPAFLVLAVWLFLFPISPFGHNAALPALIGAIITALACIFMRAPERKRQRKILAVCALTAFAYVGWSNWEEKRGFHTQAVSFENRGARLAGTLYLPDRPGKVPGIVWVHGAGPMTRGMNASIIMHFVQTGYAVLMFDKRGVGESTGKFMSGDSAISPDNVDLLASDAAAALTVLANRAEVRADKVGFVGVSQAGWITPRAAVLSGKAAFMLLLSGPVTSTYTQMRYERFHVRGAEGDKNLNLTTGFKAFTQGDIPDGMTPNQADVEAQKLPLFLPFPDVDPAVDLRALNIPGLWLLGDSDWMVPSAPTAHRIEELRKLGKPYEYRNIPGGWHGMMIGPKDLVWNAIDPWLARVTATKS